MALKKQLSKKKILIFISLVTIFVVIGILVMFRKDDNEIVDEIKDYGYYVMENSSAYHKELFKSLKDNIEDEQEYAKLVGQLFLSDFYTLQNKKSKVDIGGIQYIYKPYQEEFIHMHQLLYINQYRLLII
jgi:uncharacterized membrane protein YvbJ